MTVITTIEDLRVLAEKRVPRMFYDYADSGSWTEGTYRANSSDFQKIKLRQRVAVNMENRSTATTMVGVETKMPVCIAPVCPFAAAAKTTFDPFCATALEAARISRGLDDGLVAAQQALDALDGIDLAGGHAVAEEDAGKTFRQHHAAQGRAEGDGRVLAGTAAAEVPAGDDIRKTLTELARGVSTP